MDILVSDAEKMYIINGAEEGMRADGRGVFDYRPIIVETGVLPTTNGSARVRLASTDLLIGVKAELTTVTNLEEYRNRINFFVDCSANATPLFVGRGGEDIGEEVASVLDAAYDNPYVLPDLKSLILSPMHVWKLFVDIVILECGGNLIDAASIGISDNGEEICKHIRLYHYLFQVKAALQNTEICNVSVQPGDQGKSIVEVLEDNSVWKFDISRAPLIVSVHKLGEANLVDASLTEEACSRCTLSVAVSPSVSDSREEDVFADEMTRLSVRMVHSLQKALDRRLKEESEDVNADPLLTFLM
ncbi:unnamed protein product [Anisakis simplex]|uniref:Ribosomal RNA-processing protein 42 n=1 Tax=Anisakis simplex TaxID=6269 RepID=A0A0M3JZG4_ANISI|nr:unnamed protein product [Anisakis simplex]